MVSEADIALLRQMRLFARLSRDEMALIASGARTRIYEKGNQLFEEGDDAQHFFAVLSGWVKVFRPTPHGDHAVISIFGPGETFAETCIFSGCGYSASGEAIETCRICLFDRDAFEMQITANPRLSLGMLAAMSDHLHAMTAQVELLKTHNGEQRVADFLLRLCDRDDGACEINLPYDKTVIAARLGMRPESLSRHLARLAATGVVVQGQSVTVSDVPGLRDHLAGSALRRRSEHA